MGSSPICHPNRKNRIVLRNAVFCISTRATQYTTTPKAWVWRRNATFAMAKKPQFCAEISLFQAA
ncbi:hypothetical protein [Alysiella filiformis]|uniref:hypothetical protein n=1 Tax=Alysiella filiformis TaxID=194196 RepID=UPI001178355F|nr:hypothetical protein [Alysiella filiformis]QMT32000.1 hypothetical protein H3L97_03750 [Alysiella filiformis]UBQ57092.1 hypothetical protein JF568_04925 [Alysiella filiformis DSM 16848]